MAVLHFLNVKQGDCNWIQHADGKNTIIDVFNSSQIITKENVLVKAFSNSLVEEEIKSLGIKGNFRQKDFPVNPIEYLNKFGVEEVFRFILSHPDMDHMGGIKDFFEVFSPINFWDTDNNKEMKKGGFENSPYNEDDWLFYKHIRDKKSKEDPKRITLYAGSSGQYFNQEEDGTNGGNGLYIVAPTPELVKQANVSGDFNDSSYVIVYMAVNGSKVVFAGDSHDKTWEYILENHTDLVKDADLLLAPHHGRGSDRNYDFLEIVNPKLTFFGNANSQHLNYQPWINKGLEKFTNNQGNCLLAEFTSTGTHIYCTYEKFAQAYCKDKNYNTFYNKNLDAYYLKVI